MRFSAPVVLATLSGAAVVWALAQDAPVASSLSALEADYRAEQDKIDLVLAEFVLDASNEEISPEQAQGEIDKWIRANTTRLGEQAERADRLDREAPLQDDAPIPSATAVNPERESSPEAVRISQLNALQSSHIDALAAEASTPEELQGKIDAWTRSPEGVAIFAERASLDERLAAAWPLGTEPIVLQVPDDASPAELAALDVQERMARRIQAIRQQNPKATPEEMQALIDLHRDAVEADIAELGTLHREIRHADLVKKVQALREAVTSASAGVPPQ